MGAPLKNPADSVFTREGWLLLLVGLLRAHFELNGYPLPPRIHVSVGWPSVRAKSEKHRRVGECHHPANSADGTPHIFISPIIDDPCDVAHILVHELLHAAVGVEHGHKGPFKQGMKKVGLAGKPTATHAGPELTELIKAILMDMPAYPHPGLRPGGGRKVQVSRQLKVVCPEHTDYVVRASKKVLQSAPPYCGLCQQVMEAG